MIKKILNRLKTIKNTENSNIPPVTHANINILDNKIELDVRHLFYFNIQELFGFQVKCRHL